MPRFHSPHFGAIDYEETQVLEFPFGLPAFEDQTRFLCHQQEETRPVVYLQSMIEAQLCFITLPIETVLSDYSLSLSPEDLSALGLENTPAPELAAELDCLAIVTIPPNDQRPHPTVNLMAPVVIRRKTGRALQALQTGGHYSHQHPLPQLPSPTPKKDESCS